MAEQAKSITYKTRQGNNLAKNVGIAVLHLWRCGSDDDDDDNSIIGLISFSLSSACTKLKLNSCKVILWYWLTCFTCDCQDASRRKQDESLNLCILHAIARFLFQAQSLLLKRAAPVYCSTEPEQFLCNNANRAFL